MSKPLTITITDHTDGTVINIDAEGYVLLAMKERKENGFDATNGLHGVNAREAAQMISSVEDQHEDIKKARMVQKLGDAVGGIFKQVMGEDDDCDCEKCVARRAAEAKENESAK